MGYIVDGTCKQCGYEKQSMYLGSGWCSGWYSLQTIAKFPYYCKVCEEVVVHNTVMKPAYSCGQLMVRYDDPTLSKQKSEAPHKVFSLNIGNEELVLTDNDYLCPKCKGYTLRWSMVGLRD